MAYKSSPRGSGPVYMVVGHTAEGATTAESLGNYFYRDDVQASSHVGIDDAKTLNYVGYDRAAWTIREANSFTDNAELCGFAAWSRDEWLNHHKGMLDNFADWVQSRCQARGIPTNKLVPVQIGDRTWGVIGHADWTYGSSGLLGYQDGTHTDPGTNFPWDYVMARVTNTLEEIDVPYASFDVRIPPSPLDDDGKLTVVETVIALPWQGGAGGIARVWAMITNSNGSMELPYCHWRVSTGGGGTRIVTFLPDGTVIPPLGHSTGVDNQAPAGTTQLVIDSISAFGGSVNIEASG